MIYGSQTVKKMKKSCKDKGTIASIYGVTF